MVHGFDIPLREPEVFDRAAENSRRILDSVGVELIPVGCNFRELGDNWEDAHGAAIASCLHLFSRRYASALIASSHCYTTLRFPWGSNLLTDPMLGSGTFPIVYDAVERSRNEKARAVAEWPEAMSRLRVCWEGEHKDRNCGTCLRCVATALCFAVERLNQPASLPIPSLDEAVRNLNWPKIQPASIARLGELLHLAQANGIADSWVGVLETSIRKRQWRERWLAVRGMAASYKPPQWFSRYASRRRFDNSIG